MMKKMLPLILSSILVSCGQNSDKGGVLNQPAKILPSTNQPSYEKLNPNNKELNHEKIKLAESTILVILMDSEEIENLKKLQGEDDFYEAAQDFSWYDSELRTKMDSLNIPVRNIKKDTVYVSTPSWDYIISKDTSFSLFTYFYYNGDTLVRTDLFSLLNY
ncbi:hypothetical protein AWW67_16625 [Roseivirga seohaensis]|uniref:Lipoprotein n=1 Tax=Roseivirga seohaensis TaxID=1914963 RepID=A0A150Y352_9BACT|nr:hypothetical protein [Roseivirga seohaensis]KYG85332.1 hypothetical protein AWW67_16625 [Roseivirga seohaensis]